MNPLTLVRDFLTSIHPDAPWVTLTAAIWFAQYACRRWAPQVWVLAFAWVPEDTGKIARAALMGLPSVVAGAAIPAMASGMAWKPAVVGAVFGALAPVWHHLLRAAPGAYQGALNLPVPAPASVRDTKP